MDCTLWNDGPAQRGLLPLDGEPVMDLIRRERQDRKPQNRVEVVLGWPMSAQESRYLERVDNHSEAHLYKVQDEQCKTDFLERRIQGTEVSISIVIYYQADGFFQMLFFSRRRRSSSTGASNETT